MNAQLRIAVADDEPDMREYYQTILPHLGYRVVVVAQNGKELVEKCRLSNPDLIITDIKMPDMDGIEAAKAIQEHHPTPMILVSAHYDPELIQRAETEQVMGYLVKPVRSADLSPCIAIALRRFADAQMLENLSLTDAMTGLDNRRGFLLLAQQQMRLAQRQKIHLSLLFIDVDGLKQINDTYGHEAGDRILKATAEVLHKTFRGSDILARLGGDEFCVLAIDDAGGSRAAIDRLLRNVEKFNVENEGWAQALSLSVGATEIESGTNSQIGEFLAEADRRMYEQKQAKRNTRADERNCEPAFITQR